MKNFSRIIAACLILSIITSVLAVPGFAEGSGNEDIIISEFNDSTYYNTDDYSVVVGFYENGLLDIAYRNPVTNEVTSELIPAMQEFSANVDRRCSELEMFRQIAALLENGKLSLSNSVSAEHESAEISPQASSDEISLIYDALEEKYGAQYYRRQIYTYAADGYTGKLYHSMTFGARKDFTRVANVGITIAAAAALLGFPVEAIKILGDVAAGMGTDALINKTIFVYYANVYYQKNVDVNGEIVYSPYQTIYYNVAVSDEVYLTKTDTDTHGDYNFSNRDLVNKGIDIYIDQYT